MTIRIIMNKMVLESQVLEMFKKERINKIHQLLIEKEYISVTDLSVSLNVSEMTIRRDLKELEERGIIFRARGGAYIKKTISSEEDIEDKQIRNQSVKMRIAKKASTLIKDGMTILLDAGTTTYQIALLIAQQNFKNLIIITNDMEILQLLKNVEGIQLIILGGWIQKATHSTQGNLARLCMEELHAEISFVGASSIGENLKIYSPSEEKVFLKRLFIENSETAVLVTDRSKGKQINLNYVNSVKDMDYIITDLNFSKEAREELKKNNTEYWKI